MKKEKPSTHTPKITPFSKLSFEHFSKMCTYFNLSPKQFTESQQSCLNFPNIDTELKQDQFLDTETEGTDFEIKSKYCQHTVKISQLYSLITSKPFLRNSDSYSSSSNANFPYTKEQFTLCVKILVFILTNFNDNLFQFELRKSDFFSKQYHHINYYSLHNDYSAHANLNNNTTKRIYFTDKMNSLYNELNQINDDDYSPEVKNIYFLIHIFMLLGNLDYQSLTLETFMSNLNIYNSLICSDFKIMILIHFHMCILLDITMKNLSVEKFLTSGKKNRNSLANNNGMDIPVIYYLSPRINNNEDTDSNENEQENIDENNLYFYHYQLQLKLYLFPLLEQHMNLICNLTIITSSFKIENFIPNTKQFNTEDNNNKYSLDVYFSSKDLINLVQDYLTIHTFTMKLSNYLNQDEIQILIDPYQDIILSSKNIYFEPNNIYNNSINSISLPIESMYSELNLLQWVIKYIKKIKTTKNKKLKLKNFFFRFVYNTFRITINKDGEKQPHVREIIILISQEPFDEKKLLSYISKKNNLVELYSVYKKLFALFHSYKKYSISIRLSKKEFRNQELKYYFYLLYLLIHNLIKYKHVLNKSITLYESEYISPRFTLISNNIIKHKDKIQIFNKQLKKFGVAYLQLLNKFYEKYYDLFNTVIVHDEMNNTYPFNARIVLRNFNENELIIIHKEDCSIDMIVYIYEIEQDKIIEMIRKIRTDNLAKDVINNVTVVFHKKQFTDANYLSMNPILYSSTVNEIYIVDNESNCDCYFNEERIMIISFNKIEQYFTSIVNTINVYIDMIEYISITKRLKCYDNVALIFEKKIFVFKNSTLTIKKIADRSYYSIIATNIISSKYSYPLMTIYTHKPNSFTLKELIMLFENNLKNHSHDNNKLKEIVCDIIKSNADNLKCAIYNQKYYDYLRRLLCIIDNNNKFLEVNIIPLLKINNFNLHPEEKISLSKVLNVFKFVNVKTNHSNINDIARPLSSSRLLNTIDTLFKQAKCVTKGVLENKFTEKGEILSILVYIFERKYMCNYLTRKDLSIGIVKYLFELQGNTAIVKGNNNETGNNVYINVVNYDTYVDLVYKYKKNKRQRVPSIEKIIGENKKNVIEENVEEEKEEEEDGGKDKEEESNVKQKKKKRKGIGSLFKRKKKVEQCVIY